MGTRLVGSRRERSAASASDAEAAAASRGLAPAQLPTGKFVGAGGGGEDAGDDAGAARGIEQPAAGGALAHRHVGRVPISIVAITVTDPILISVSKSISISVAETEAVSVS